MQYWRRYIYLWINYAVYEEMEAEDIGRTREVYRTCLDLIPHKRFTFAKIWLLYAQVGSIKQSLHLSQCSQFSHKLSKCNQRL